jgi:two-component system, OmpR family, sensor histidine kinase MprB
VPLRKRLSLVAAAAVAVSIATAAGVCYWVVRNQLRSQIDQALSGQAVLIQHNVPNALASQIPGLPASAGGSAPYTEIVTPSKNVLLNEGGLPYDALVSAVANGRRGSAFEDITVSGVRLRLYAFHGVLREGTPVAVVLARPLSQVDSVLSHLRLILLFLAAAGVALAAALGRLAADRVLAPLAEVAQTAQHVSETEDLTSRIRVHADDEVGQLAMRFNAMIERLQRSRAQVDESMAAQRQLVADASHELRTPVTSLRTNIEVLLAGGELDPESRDRLLSDVVEQTEELSALVGDLIELARGDLPLAETEDVRLDKIVSEAVARARRNSPGIAFEVATEPTLVDGVPERLARAVSNLLDNAARHSPAGGVVEVTVDAEGVRVRDHGSGVDEADLPYIFDRFYRGVNSRGRQGSGLGLAIVRQAAEQHGGQVSAENAPGGGALLTLQVPARHALPSGATGAGDREEVSLEESRARVPGARS